MPDSFNSDAHALVNTFGHAAGVLIFGTFLTLAIRHRTLRQLQSSRLSLLAAALAFTWNLASLAVLVGGVRAGLPLRITAAAGIRSLRPFPAVIVPMCLC